MHADVRDLMGGVFAKPFSTWSTTSVSDTEFKVPSSFTPAYDVR
jgi:hypothetical protein